MKKAILFFALLFAAMAPTFAQNARKDANGNYTAIQQDTSTQGAKSTGKTFTDGKGTKYDVMETAKGKLYYMRTSAKGNIYKCYLKL